MPSFLLSLLAGAVVFAAGSGSPTPPPPPIAIVAHPSTSVTSLTVRDLGRIYTGEVRTFSEVCIQRRLGDTFFETVTGQSASAIGRRWVRLLLSGRVAEGPVSLRTDAEVLAYVRDHAGAIGFVSSAATAQSPGVKRIRVQGDGADTNGYLRPSN